MAGQLRAGEAPPAAPTLNDLLAKASQDEAAGNMAAAEDALKQAAPLAAGKDDATRWANAVWTFVMRSKSIDDGVAAFKRLAPLAASGDAKASLAAASLAGSRNYLRSGDFDKGITLFNGVRDFAATVPNAAGLLQFLEQLAHGHALAKAGDVDGSIRAFQGAAVLAPSPADQVKDTYAAALVQAKIRAGAKDAPATEKYVAFLLSLPGSAVGSFAPHYDVGWIRHNLGQYGAARDEALAAAQAASEKEWQHLYYLLGTVLTWGESADASLALMDRLAPLALAPEAKKSLAKAGLSSAGRYLTSKDFQKGLEILDRVKALGFAAEEVTGVVPILEQIGQARTASDVVASVNALKAAAGSAAGKPEWLNRIYEAAYGMAVARAQAKDKPGADAYGAFITTEMPAIDAWRMNTEMARLGLMLLDLPAAADHLVKAAPLMRSKGDANSWADIAAEVVAKVTDATEASAAFGRISRAAATNDAKSSLAVSFLDAARKRLLEQKPDAAKRAVDEAKTVAMQFPDLSSTVQFVDQLVVAQSLASTGDGKGAVEALQGALGLAGQKEDLAKDLYRITQGIAWQRAYRADKDCAGQIAAFIAQNCAAAAEPYVFYSDLASLQYRIGNLEEAEAHLTTAAPLINTAEQARAWAETAWCLTSRNKTLDDGIAALGRLALLATTAEAKTALAQRLIQGTRQWLTGGDYAKGLSVLPVTDQIAAGLSAQQPMVQFIDHLGKAHELGAKNDIDGSINELKTAYAMTAGKQDMAKDVYQVCVIRAGAQVERGDRLSCDRLIGLIQEGLATAVKPCVLHRDLSVLRLRLHQTDEAREELLQAATEARDDDDWNYLSGMLAEVATWTAPAAANLQFLDAVGMLAKTNVAHRVVALARASMFAHQFRPAEAEAALKQVLPKEQVRDLQMLRMAYIIADTYSCLSQTADAYRMFTLAEMLGKSCTEAERDYWFRCVFYHANVGGRRIPLHFHSVLKQTAADASDAREKDRFLRLYAEAAGKVGLGEEAVQVLRDQNAQPGAFVELAAALVKSGKLAPARKALAAIPAAAVKDDATLAQKIDAVRQALSQ